MNTKAKGNRNERKCKATLEDEGYYVIKAGASLGEFDLVALGQDYVRLIQVKSNNLPRPAERKQMIKVYNDLYIDNWCFECGDKSPYVCEIWVYTDRKEDPRILTFVDMEDDDCYWLDNNGRRLNPC